MKTSNQNIQEPSKVYRWTVLVFVSMAMFGNYYIYDSISPLADLLVKQLKFTDSDIGLLNAIYSIPNIFMVLIGGFVIDRIGTKKGAFIFSILCMLGAFITAFTGDLTTMAAGRLVFGLGAESLIVTITTIIAKWFKGKELSFAFGLNLTIARLGSFAALNSPTWGRDIYQYWQDPLWVAFWAGVISVISVLIYIVLDRAAEKKFAVGKEGEQDKVIFSDIFRFGKSFWFITLLCVTFYSAMFPFQTFAVKFFKDAHLFNMPEDIARGMGGFLSSILTLSAMVLTPLFGLLADKIGKRSLLMMIGSVLIIPVYLIMAYFKVAQNIPPDVVNSLSQQLNDSDFFNFIGNLFSITKVLLGYFPNIIIPMFIMGLSFSLIPAVMWPSVAYIVDSKKLGTAYGLMTMIQNIGLAGFNLLIGWANDFSAAGPDNPAGYNLGMWIFSSLGFFGLLFAFLLRRAEAKKTGFNLESGMQKKEK